MRKNNFDKNSQGPSIELTCFYDTMLSQHEFDENFKVMQHEGYHTWTKAYYTDNGNVPSHDEITFRLKATDDQKIEFLKKEGYTDDDMPPPEDMAETILDTYGERLSLLNYLDAEKVFAPMTIEPSKRIEWIKIRGYSQGDYAEVAYSPDDLKECWGNAPVENDLHKTFQRLFYDAPVYALFEIDGKEYRYDEDMPDSYEWDREAWAKIVAEKSGIAAETLLNFLPQYPDYL